MGFESNELWDGMKKTKYQRTFDYLHTILRSTHGDMNEAITVALDTVCEAVHAEAGTFWFFSRFGDGMIHPRAQFGGKPMEGFFLAPGEGIAGQVIETGESMLIVDCQKDPRWAGRVDAKTGFVTKSMICVPLMDEEKSFGCIQLINKTDGSLFDEKDSELVRALAKEISVDFVNLNLLSDGRLIDKVAVMFVDIRGFSLLCRNRGPIEIADAVNRFLSFVTNTVTEFSGHPNKYIGDCVMAYWEGADCTKKACEAAKTLMEKASEFNADLKEKLNFEFGFGVGINVGEAFVGNIGSSVLSDHTVFGNMVNEASYLEANAPAGKIYVSEAVASELKNKEVFKGVSGLMRRDRKLNIKIFSLEF